jgi:phosphoribosylformimino-5-aminoimidazole carboxamide ribotide isomerase
VAAVILYPAIDLKDGQCVRLLRGEMSAATVFNADPADQARQWERAGFAWLHLVDLNGAIEGKPVNGAAVEAILRAIAIPAQLGGGIRDMARIEDWLAKGIRRVILGTVALTNPALALTDPALVKAACKRFPGRVAVGIDARGGKVATEGWVKTSETTALDLARAFADAGVAAIIYTDIDRDGALQGVNVAATAALARATKIPVIASGGVAGLADVEALKAEGGIAGVVIGRALYDGRVDAKTALEIAA